MLCINDVQLCILSTFITSGQNRNSSYWWKREMVCTNYQSITPQAGNQGVIIDSDLTVKPRTKNLIRTVFCSFNNVQWSDLFFFLKTQRSLFILFFFFFFTSTLNYYNTLLSGIPNSSINQLQLIHNAAVGVKRYKEKNSHHSWSLHSPQLGLIYDPTTYL